MKRVAHAQDGGLIDTVQYTPQDIATLRQYCDNKLASGEATKDDVYELATVPGEFIEHWCHVRGITFAVFMRDETIQTEFINSDFAKPFRVWKGRF